MDAPAVPTIAADIFDVATQAESNAAWKQARRAAPVVRTGRDDRLWLLTRYDEVCAAFRDWERFSSARTDPEVAAITVSKARVPMLVPQELDPPAWFPVRRLLAELLSPAAAEEMRPRVRHWTEHYLDEVIGAGRCDFVTDLAVPVPAAVTMEFLGFPEADWMPLAGVFHDISAYPTGHPIREAAIIRFGDVFSASRSVVEQRRTEPRDDGVSAIVAAADGSIDDEMLTHLVTQVMGGGVDTTTALTSAALVHLGRDHELRAALRTDPSLWTTATEEFLRMYPPARTFARTVTGDTELSGCPMLEGDRVVVSQISANYDALAFPEPETFRVNRFPNRHVSFGIGIHRCPGSHLARIMFTEMVGAVLERMPDYVVDERRLEEYPYWASIGGWAHIPVTFTPTR